MRTPSICHLGDPAASCCGRASRHLRSGSGVGARAHTRTSRIVSAAALPSISRLAASSTVPDGGVSVLLLAGGVGKRMGASVPKQYLQLAGSAIATYSLRTFCGMREVREVVIVCDPSWRDVFAEPAAHAPRSVAIKWALPGPERQDSVFNGLQEATADLIAVHDSARPLVTASDASRCFLDGWQFGAAVLGVMVKPTIKVVDASGLVVETLQRSKLWEVQTPQVIRADLLREGFAFARANGLDVTDDVSVVEALGRPVKITPGTYANIKITTPDDLFVAEKFLEDEFGA